jgi:hypothetical protein
MAVKVFVTLAPEQPKRREKVLLLGHLFVENIEKGPVLHRQVAQLGGQGVDAGRQVPGGVGDAPRHQRNLHRVVVAPVDQRILKG